MTAVLLPATNDLHLVSTHDGDRHSRKQHGRTIHLRSADDDIDNQEQAVTESSSPTLETDDAVDMALPAAVSKAYGGIRNLGNTCYFNSALQLLASLDSFTQALNMTEPKQSEDGISLRKEFLSVMEALARGETVQPDSFKKALDSRTSLFLGFRQQDSHEFLTTLLELLDEDYQKKPEEKGHDNGETDSPMDIEEVEEPTESEALDDEVDMDLVQVHSSPLQLPRCLSELDVDDISALLNGSPNEQLELEKPALRIATDNNFKLIGGRINNTCTGVMQWLGSAAPVGDEDTSISSAPSNESTEDSTHDQEEDDDDASTAPSFSSPVDDYFTTQVNVQLTCDSCKYTRSHLETYRHLSLEIGTNGGSIEDGLRKLFSPEKRDIKCEKCFCECATQTTEIVRLPRALLLHFKRFIVDYSPDFRSATYRKNHATVQFDERLKIRGEESVMEDFLSSEVTLPESFLETSTASFYQPQPTPSAVGQYEYRVRGIVNHHGASASCGHYNADAHKLYLDGQREWTRFNDSTVSIITPKQALNDSSRTAYMVVYELVSSSTS
jgi:ubiquitin C-terminal hydrolase